MFDEFGLILEIKGAVEEGGRKWPINERRGVEAVTEDKNGGNKGWREIKENV